ncbi:hypothetical protein QYE76_068956 [Lolium multiflorum]|uniref:Uncharacterized protein n=1 Tax=Lolium multiflorum TaxID=4521 RepID=A0AAD8WC68_LOLMU|nr:hypothetical protein QYE76_068956 [Lolium multiflorum]
MAMNHVDESSRNLALKARADFENEQVYEIEEHEDMTSTSDIATDFAFFAKKYKVKFPTFFNEKKKKKRTCYNCDEDGHFANECPYEKMVDKPKFVKGFKLRLKPNPINDRYKKNKGRAFVGAEYTSEEESEEEEEEEEEGRSGWLKKELAKFTTTKNKMGLDDLLSKQMSNNQKHGLGYAPKPYKKNNYKKEKPAQEKNKKVTNDGKASKGKATNGDRTGPNNHYALFIDYYGDVYANYVGPRNGYAYRGYSIWGYSSGGPKWVFDSGCTNHMTGGRGVLDQFIEDVNKKSSITFGDNSKGNVLGEFIIFAKKAQHMYESEIKAIRTNNGTEFKHHTMQEFVDDEGINHEFSAPYTPQQNGDVERKNRTIIEMARTMLSEFNSPHNFWGEAISTAVHYSNRLFLRPLHNKTPYELLTGNKPNVMYIRVFGCKCLVKNNKGKLGKFETRTIEGTFVGYAENSHAYRYYNKSTGAIEVSCDVVFLEDNGSQVEQVVPCAAGDDDPSNAIKLMGIGHIRPTEVHTDDQSDEIELKNHPPLKMSHIPKNKKKSLIPLSKTIMMIKKHPQLMFKLKLSLMIEY